MNILILDKAAGQCRNLLSHLSEWGYVYMQAHDMDTALALYNSDKPELMLVSAAFVDQYGVPKRLEKSLRSLLYLSSQTSLDEQWLQQFNQLHFQQDPIALLQLRLSELTKTSQLQQQVSVQAQYDSLTGLPNRRLFEERMIQALRLDQRMQLLGCVMLLDLDHFKWINDAQGHAVADQLLNAVAHRLLHCVRGSDTIARLGGDEFCVLLPQVPGWDGAQKLADKLLQQLAKPFLIEGERLHISASVGICLFPSDGETAESLMRRAETAMYAAKQAGRNTFRFFTKEMQGQLDARNLIIQNLHQALARDELFLVFQPKISLISRAIFGFEALLRWQHEGGGMTSPDVFIPLAEETGLINSIGEWVLIDACKQMQQWRLKHPLQQHLVLSINVSMCQLTSGRFDESVSNALQCSGLPGHCLQLEITETALAQNIDKVARTLESIHNSGVSIAIDDFGTGYSSLNYIKRLAIDCLKIDKSFVQDIGVDRSNESIVKAVIAIARSLNLEVIAEGVESLEQLLFLQQNECHFIQGYYFSRPLTLPEINKLFQREMTQFHSQFRQLDAFCGEPSVLLKGDRAQVLAVDDNEDSLHLIMMSIGDEFKVDVALDGPACLSKVEQQKPDVILLDMLMPGMDGGEVAAQLKHHAHTEDLPIIALTSLSEHDLINKFPSLQIDGYIQKPFDNDLLLDKVRSLLQRNN